MKRNSINTEEVKNTFRLNKGKLEKVNRNFKDGRYTVVVNKNNSAEGYCQVMCNKKTILYHNILWILSTGEDIPEGYEIDHINGNKIDNRLENLRLVTHRINQQNRKEHRNGNLCGSWLQKKTNKYKALIQIGNNKIHLGYFDTAEEAHEVYCIACKHTEEYVDNSSFRELVKRSIPTSTVH